MLVKMLMVFILGVSPALAIYKCTTKYTVGYQLEPCPETAIKSEIYEDKVGSAPRNPAPRYTKKSDTKLNSNSTIPKTTRKKAAERVIDLESGE